MAKQAWALVAVALLLGGVSAARDRSLLQLTCDTAADWWQCCVDNNHAASSLCPPTECGKLTSGIKECCSYKGGWDQDKTCTYDPDSPPRVCESAGPDNFWPCCNKKNQLYSNWGNDKSCPPLRCGDLSAEGKKACCTHKGYSQDASCAADYQPASTDGTVSKNDIPTSEPLGPELVCYTKNETLTAVASIVEGAKADVAKASKASAKVSIALGALDSIKVLLEETAVEQED